MNNLLRLLSLFALTYFFAASAHAAEGGACDLVGDATRAASDIRGLKIRRSVPCRMQNKAQVEKFLLDTIKEEIPQERLRYEGESYRILGIIPKDYKYLEGIVDLYTSQLGGYYDPQREFYAMASWMPNALQFPIAVHELTHALQDQYFELDKMLDHRSHSNDVLAARSALVEGDATAVMMDFSRSLAGQAPIAQEQSVAAIMMQNIAGAMISSSMQEAPQALQAMLIFPYISGLRFAHALLQEGGYRRIDEAFGKLPESTEHILHPELYLKGERGFLDVPVPAVPVGVQVASTTPLHTDRLGEFFVSTFLGTQLPPEQASVAAAGWGGDSLALYPLTESARYVLIWELRWDSGDDSDEFFSALTRYYEKRLGQAPNQSGSVASFIDPDFGPVEILKRDDFVRLRVGS